MVSRQDGKNLWPLRLVQKGWRMLRGLLLTLLMVILVALVVLVLPISRGGLLRMVLSQAHRFLPGELSVEEVSWPGLGRLEIQGLVWRVAETDSLAGIAVGDTLAKIGDLRFELDLESLRAGDLLAREVSLMAVAVDVPSIIKLFPANSDSAGAGKANTSATSSFLREGALPFVPSIAVQSLKLKIRDTRLSESLMLTEAELSGMLELRADHPAAVRLGQGRVRLEMRQNELMILNADTLELALSADYQKREFRLERLLVRVPEAGPPDIRDAWLKAEPINLRLKGEGSWTDTGLSVVLKGVGSLPGPDHLRPLLPAEFPARISGPLIGRFDLDATIADLSAPDPVAQVRMDFTETSWLDSFKLVAELDQRTITVDTLKVALMGSRLNLSGAVDSTEVEAKLDAQMLEPTLLHLLGGSSWADADAGLDLQASVKGLWPVPAVDLVLVASVRTTDLEVPTLNCRVQTLDRSAEVQLSLDLGMKVQTVEIDSLRLNWAGDLSRPDSLSHRFQLGVWSPLGRVALGGSGIIDTLRTVIVDSLVVVSLDSTMRTPQPFTVVHGPGPRDLLVENLRMVGGLGSIALDCSIHKSDLTLQMDTDLLLQESFLMMVAPNEFWNSGGGTDLSIKAAVDLKGSAEGPSFEGRASALLLPHRDNPEIGVDLDFYLVLGDSSALGADLDFHADKTSFLSGHFRWPGHPDLETGRWVAEAGRGLEARFSRQVFDLAQLNQIMPPDVELSGFLDFAGELREQAEDAGPGEPSVGRSFLSDALINAHLGVEKLEVKLPNRSRVALRIDTNLGGLVSDPVIEGKIEVLSGFFRIPELPRVLLPVEGESLLWRAMAQEVTAEGDSIGTGNGSDLKNQGPVLGEEKPAIIPDLNLSLEMPGNIIVSGFGLNLELEGSLQATRGVDHEGTAMIVLKGHAGVQQGTLKFMNNIFDVEKADIEFSQAAPPNPHLDVQLAAEVSGYLIYLKVTGFADDPVIELSSEPEMNEPDIMAVLLFGQPVNDLDNDQRGLAQQENDPGAQLRENLAAMAMVFGGAGLQNKMTNTFGVDMVEMGSGSSGDTTIMVGKFLTPRILLKYNQSLEKSGTYFMTLEYRLSQYFKLLSTYGQGQEASGLELKWTRRY